ncbi:uncharacterized protein LOC130050615 [Ostrea edulis]|uniref:uncharacterized protein LOC130050615 n=1 Tax=Ostrea edulis TaxID=37623 RepID=UPI0024AF0EB0|nr:uncharacterized protein LOC130050615 [Ostrea edulis]
MNFKKSNSVFGCQGGVYPYQVTLYNLSAASQIDSVTIHSANEISHISFITRGELWVSDFDTLLKVDSAGNILNDEYKVRYYPLGSHIVTMDFDFLFVNDNGVHKLSSDGVITTLFITPKAHCIHSSRINGNILVGSYDDMTRYNDIGRKLQVIKKDDRGRSLYIATVYITENKNGDIWTSDKIKGAVVVVDKSGAYRFDYTGRQSHFVPHDICTDVLGQVLVCDVYNHSVNILDQDGQFLSTSDTRTTWGASSHGSVCGRRTQPLSGTRV